MGCNVLTKVGVGTCAQCERPGTRFFLADSVSGRVGWCSFCNWKLTWDPVIRVIGELSLPFAVKACLFDFLVPKPASGRIEAKVMIDIRFFFEMLLAELPMDRVALRWFPAGRSFGLQFNATPAGFHRLYARRLRILLGENPDLHRWQEGTTEFLSAMCPPGKRNLFKWKDASHPDCDWVLSSPEISRIAFATCYRVACHVVQPVASVVTSDRDAL